MSERVAANPKHKRHPRRQARRERAMARERLHTCTPSCKRYRTGREKWPVKA